MQFWKSITMGILVSVSTFTASSAERGWFRRSALPPESKEALVEALAGPDGEYAAQAQYSAIIEKFGNVQPYVSIRAAESRHIAALERQFEKYGITVPTNSFQAKVKAPETLLEAAKQSIAREERNVAMYDKLFQKVEKRPDLVRVFTHLQGASQDGHLPAFKAALENGGKLEQDQGPCGMPYCLGRSCCMQDEVNSKTTPKE